MGIAWGSSKRTVLPLIMESPRTRQELVDLLGWQRRQVDSALSSLIDDGLIRRVDPPLSRIPGRRGPAPGKYTFREYAESSHPEPIASPKVGE